MSVLTSFIGVLSPIIVLILSFYLKKKELERQTEMNSRDEQLTNKLNERQKIILDRIDSLELLVREIDKTLQVHVCDDNFRKNYRKNIKLVTVPTLKNQMLHQTYKNMINYFAELLEKLGLTYYYSGERKEKFREREKFLFQEKELMLNTFINYVNSISPGYRTVGNKRKNFVDLLVENRVFGPLETLVIDLARNGLTDEQLTEKFEDCIDKFTDNLIAASVIWANVTKNEKIEND